jgi:hypothetical protein
MNDEAFHNWQSGVATSGQLAQMGHEDPLPRALMRATLVAAWPSCAFARAVGVAPANRGSRAPGRSMIAMATEQPVNHTRAASVLS